MAILADQCSSTNANVSRSSCPIRVDKPGLLLIAPDVNATLANTVLETKTDILAEIQAKRLFVIPDIIDAPESTVNDGQVNQTGYGGYVVTSTRTSADLTFGLNISLANLRELNKWDGRTVGLFMAQDGGGIVGRVDDADINTDGTYTMKAVPATLRVGSLPIRTNEGDIVLPTIRVLIDNWTANQITKPTDYDPSLLNGVINTNLTTSDPSTTALTVTVKEAANNTAVAGFEAADFDVQDNTGASQTITSVTDNGDGTYTFAFTGVDELSAGDFTVNFAQTVEDQTGSDSLYESTGAADFTVL